MARRSSTGSGLLGRARSLGFARGVMGRSGPWFWIWAALWVFGKVRGRAGAEVLLSEKLEPGQRIVIANDRATIEDGPLPVRRTGGGGIKAVRERRPSRRERRRQRRAARD